MTMQPFNVFNEPLQNGTNLIEASAGTGKTYTIAMLILRFIVERELSIEQLLVVTFTRAATEELRLRIRARLLEALNSMVSGQGEAAAQGDPQLRAWLEGLEIPAAEIIKRLRLALLDIDRASIFTIHGLCQRLLSEFPLDGGQQFELELMADTSAIMQAIMDDFWRREIYSRPRQQVAALLWRYATPDELYSSVRGIDWRQRIYPAASGLDSALHNLAECFERVQQQWQEAGESLSVRVSEMVEAGRFIKAYRDTFTESWQQLDRFCRGESDDVPGEATLQMLARARLQSGQGLMKKFWDEADSIEFTPLDDYVAALIQLQLELRLKVIDWLASEYDKRMESASLLSFDSLIVRMGELLDGERSAQLQQAIQDKFAVALIDEFQDTDQTQWGIFARLFAGAQGPHFLYLIGDPKQAIYKFRGADIFSYFAAQQQASRSYTLESNWRSTPQLVESINRLFEPHPAPFVFDALKFHAARPAKSLADGHIATAGAPTPPLVLWQLPQSGQSSGFWPTHNKSAEEAISRDVVAEILQLLASNTNTAIVSNKGDRPLAPGDIAILVRSHKQAFEYQRLLAEVGIPSVHSGSTNIFSSAEAQGLLPLLAAVANPGDLNRLKNLLTLPWCGLDGQAVNGILTDDHLLSGWFEQLHRFHQQWLNNGVMAMVASLLDELLIHHMARLPNPERTLTNINHLAELLQREADEQSLGIHKTVAWLQGEIVQTSAGSDAAKNEQQLRLESDAAALKIITMHSAKGLEFPVVFLPCLWQRANFLESEKNRISCHEDGALVTDIGSADFEQRRVRALKEELAEELRLLYVALTRAKYRCYLSWADARTSDTPNRSALAYLLFSSGGDNWLESLREVDYQRQQQQLRTLASENPDRFGYRELVATEVGALSSQQRPEEQLLSARQFTRRLSRRWQMSSYSALANMSASVSVPDSTLQPPSLAAPVSVPDLTLPLPFMAAHELHQLPELPLDKAQERREMAVSDAPESELPRGAHFGNVLHELLELIPFGELASGASYPELRDRTLQRYGLELNSPEQLRQLEQLLQRVVTTPLTLEDSHFTLANIAPASTLKEMPFYCAMQQTTTRAINQLLKDERSVAPLHEIELEGYLTGFIDLIFEYAGRFYIVDYKSNYLDSYHDAALEQAMLHHNYGLQYWIYSVVLHRYLQGRLADYSYERHFGGALYLFARGMEPAQPGSGVYRARPAEELLLALDKALGGGRVDDH
jgi:exodeoxyribonuclease V beta subunit